MINAIEKALNSMNEKMDEMVELTNIRLNN